MSTLWSAEQRQWLQAMGHQVWNVSAPGALVESEAGAMQAAAALLESPAPSRAASTRPQAAPRVVPQADRLMQAVLRAANRGAGDGAVSALLPDASALRGNAAAKRALWPRLRRLRGQDEGQ